MAFRLLLATNIESVGVLPYTSIDGKIYVLMGQEEKTNKLVSFEGKVTGDLFFENVSRNTSSATKGVLSINLQSLKYTPALLMGSLAIIFSKSDSYFRATARHNYFA